MEVQLLPRVREVGDARQKAEVIESIVSLGGMHWCLHCSLLHESLKQAMSMCSFIGAECFSDLPRLETSDLVMVSIYR